MNDRVTMITCEIALGGDIRNTVVKGPTNPVTWPEAVVIEAVHGGGSVTKHEIVEERPYNKGAEHQRLLEKYGPIVGQIYPGRGRNIMMEGVMPSDFDPEAFANGLSGAPDDQPDDPFDVVEDDEPVSEPVSEPATDSIAMAAGLAGNIGSPEPVPAPKPKPYKSPPGKFTSKNKKG